MPVERDASVNTDEDKDLDSELGGTFADAVKAWNDSKKPAPDVEKVRRELSAVERLDADQTKRKEAIASKLDSLSAVFRNVILPTGEAENTVRADAVVVMDDLKRHFNGEAGHSLSGDALENKLNNLSTAIEGYFPPGSALLDPARRTFDNLLTEVAKEETIKASIDKVNATVQKNRGVTQARRDEARGPFQNRIENFRPAPLNPNELMSNLEDVAKMKEWSRDFRVRAAGLIRAADEKPPAFPKRTPPQTPRTSFDGSVPLDPQVPLGPNIPTPLSRTDSFSSFDSASLAASSSPSSTPSSTPRSSRSPSPEPQSPKGKGPELEAPAVPPIMPPRDESSSSPKPESSPVGLAGVGITEILSVTPEISKLESKRPTPLALPAQTSQETSRPMTTARVAMSMLPVEAQGSPVPPPLPTPPISVAEVVKTDLASVSSAAPRSPSAAALREVLRDEPRSPLQTESPLPLEKGRQDKPYSPEIKPYSPEIKFDNFVTEQQPSVVRKTRAVSSLQPQTAIVSQLASVSEMTSLVQNPDSTPADGLSDASLARSSTPSSKPRSSRSSSPDPQTPIVPPLSLPVSGKYALTGDLVVPDEISIKNPNSARSDVDPAQGLALGEDFFDKASSSSPQDPSGVENTDPVDMLLDQYLANGAPAESASPSAVLTPEKSDVDFENEYFEFVRKLSGVPNSNIQGSINEAAFSVAQTLAGADKKPLELNAFIKDFLEKLFQNGEFKQFLKLCVERGYNSNPVVDRIKGAVLSYFPDKTLEKDDLIRPLAARLSQLAEQNKWIKFQPSAKSKKPKDRGNFEKVKVKNDPEAFPAKGYRGRGVALPKGRLPSAGGRRGMSSTHENPNLTGKPGLEQIHDNATGGARGLNRGQAKKGLSD